MNETRKAVISVLGTDKKGIIAQVSRILYENDANILDITQTIVSGLFSIILIADVSSEACSFDTLKTELDALGDFPENACIVPGKTDEVLIAGTTPKETKARAAL